jgi:hypothetical protein
MLKKIIAVLAGILTGFILIGLVEALGQYIFPTPAELLSTNPEFPEASEWIEAIPLEQMLMVLLAYVLGSFGAGFITTSISPSKSLSLITGFILLISGTINVLLIPHPLWFTIISISLYIPFAYGGGIISIRMFKKS